MKSCFVKYAMNIIIIFGGLGSIANIYATDSTSVTAPQNVSTEPQTSYILYVSPVIYSPDKPYGASYYYYQRPLTQACMTGYSACVNLVPYDSNDWGDKCAGAMDEVAIHYKIEKNKDPSSTAIYQIYYEYEYYLKKFPSCMPQNYGGDFYYTITCVLNQNVSNSAKTQVNYVGPICI